MKEPNRYNVDILLITRFLLEKSFALLARLQERMSKPKDVLSLSFVVPGSVIQLLKSLNMDGYLDSRRYIISIWSTALRHWKPESMETVRI